MFIDVHTHVNHSKESIQSIHAHDFLNGNIPAKQFFTTGIHPWFVEKVDPIQFAEKLKEYSRNKLIGIGECGLDRNKGPQLDLQKVVFETQLQLVRELRLPVVVHQVKAISDLLPFLKSFQDLTFVLHGYNGNQQQTQQLLTHNVYFSFGDYIQKATNKLLKTISEVPLTRLFLETDESLISIEELYGIMAQHKSVSINTLIDQVKENFNNVFKVKFDELD